MPDHGHCLLVSCIYQEAQLERCLKFPIIYCSCRAFVMNSANCLLPSNLSEHAAAAFPVHLSVSMLFHLQILVSEAQFPSSQTQLFSSMHEHCQANETSDVILNEIPELFFLSCFFLHNYRECLLEQLKLFISSETPCSIFLSRLTCSPTPTIVQSFNIAILRSRHSQADFESDKLTSSYHKGVEG